MHSVHSIYRSGLSILTGIEADYIVMGYGCPYLPKLDASAPVVPHVHGKNIQHNPPKKQETNTNKQAQKMQGFHGMTSGKHSLATGLKTCDDCISAKRRSLSSWRTIVYDSSHSSIQWRMELVNKLHCREFHPFLCIPEVECPCVLNAKFGNIFYLFVGPYVESIPNSLALVPLSHTQISSKRITNQAIPGQMHALNAVEKSLQFFEEGFLILCAHHRLHFSCILCI